MGILRQISRVITGSAPPCDGTAALVDAYGQCLTGADRLRAAAELAPDAGSRTELLDLARAETDLADRLWESLADRVPARPVHLPPARSQPERSHWARLVETLEAHRAAAQRYRDLATQLTEPSPATAALFEQLSGAQAALCRGLRALIARADPQAID